jgi:hypothetical protein
MKGIRFGVFPGQLDGSSFPDAVHRVEMPPPDGVGRQLANAGKFYQWDPARLTRDIPMLLALQHEGTGRDLHLRIKPVRPGNPVTPVPWASIAAGEHNDELEAFAAAIAQLDPRRLRLTFSHEPDVNAFGKYGPDLGTPPEFCAAWPVFFGAMPPVRSVLVIDWWVDMEQFWPGGAFVDVLGVDLYNREKWTSLEQLAQNGMSFAREHHVPLYLTEVGCLPDPRRPAWIDESTDFLAANTDLIRWIAWWNQRDDRFGDYTITNDPPSLAALARQAAHPAFARAA